MIEPSLLEAVAARVESGEIHAQNVAVLREAFPGTHFTWCMEDDIGMEQPVAERAGFNLYLVDGQAHCLKLTTDMNSASGIVIAELIDV